MKKYFIYKARNNPNLKGTHQKLKKIFGNGYFFDKKYPNVKKISRKEIKEKFTKDMKKGNFDLIIVDITHGKGRMMKEEIALAKKLKIPIIEVNFLK
jgi:NAD kinase